MLRHALGALLSATLTLVTVGSGATPALAAPVTGTVVGPLNVRAAPNTSSALVRRLPDKARIAIACSMTGQRIQGPARTSDQWDKLAGGQYVSHAYVRVAKAPPPCPGQPVLSPIPAPGLPTQTNAQFIAAAVAPAQRNQREHQVPASVTIAQAILESGWGRSGLTLNDRNYFGIKCFNGVYGPIATGCHRYKTTECLPTCAPTTAEFRTYASMTDSFRDHGRFLTVNQRYKPAFAYTKNPDQFLYQIWKAGYATSPTYVTNVKAVMVKYNLYRYDLP